MSVLSVNWLKNAKTLDMPTSSDAVNKIKQELEVRLKEVSLLVDVWEFGMLQMTTENVDMQYIHYDLSLVYHNYS